MRGVVDYSPHPTVAILDSQRPGESHKGIPVVGSVGRRASVRADDGARRSRDPGRPLPAGLARPAEGLDRSRPRPRERPARVHLRGSRARRAGDATRRRAARPAQAAARSQRPDGRNLELSAKTVLTVGSDCAIGKKTVAIELDREARARGLESQFVPTGQTGVAIAGWGIAIDAVVADFIAGAAERLVVEGAERGGELLFVEGQGALSHPAYSGVTLGLMHGSAPHAYVLCHVAGATEIEGYPGYPLPPLRGDRRAARARVASLSPRSCRRDRAQHARPRRRRGPNRGSRRRRGDRAADRRSRPLRGGEGSRRRPDRSAILMARV